jgi:VanZ family protein
MYYSLICALSQGNPGKYIIYPFNNFDKILHFCEYSILGFVLARSFFWETTLHHFKKNIWFYIPFMLFFLGAADEIHQYFVPYRQMDVFDLMADMAGGMTGALVGMRLYRWRLKTLDIE